jgi:hypothetical protein
MMEAAVDALTRVLVTYAESPHNPSLADSENSDNSAANPDDAETVAPAPWLD